MASRLSLHEELCTLLGSRNVYYQPPESIRMNYPAIVYSRSDIGEDYADDKTYLMHHQYSITLIDKNPDSVFVDKLALFKGCRFNRHYTADNLNHDVFTLYY